MTISTTRARHFMGAALVLTTALGCHAKTSPTAESQTLAVQNSSEFQVNIYAVPSAPSARIRLGSVAPLSSGRFDLPRMALGVGGELRLIVDPIGSTSEWVSPTVNIPSDSRACLRVMADMSGDLGRSTLITQLSGASCP